MEAEKIIAHSVGFRIPGKGKNFLYYVDNENSLSVEKAKGFLGYMAKKFQIKETLFREYKKGEVLSNYEELISKSNYAFEVMIDSLKRGSNLLEAINESKKETGPESAPSPGEKVFEEKFINRATSETNMLKFNEDFVEVLEEYFKRGGQGIDTSSKKLSICLFEVPYEIKRLEVVLASRQGVSFYAKARGQKSEERYLTKSILQNLREELMNSNDSLELKFIDLVVRNNAYFIDAAEFYKLSKEMNKDIRFISLIGA